MLQVAHKIKRKFGMETFGWLEERGWLEESAFKQKRAGCKTIGWQLLQIV